MRGSGHQVGLELCDIDVEGPVEAQEAVEGGVTCTTNQSKGPFLELRVLLVGSLVTLFTVRELSYSL